MCDFCADNPIRRSVIAFEGCHPFTISIYAKPSHMCSNTSCRRWCHLAWLGRPSNHPADLCVVAAASVAALAVLAVAILIQVVVVGHDGERDVGVVVHS